MSFAAFSVIAAAIGINAQAFPYNQVPAAQGLSAYEMAELRIAGLTGLAGMYRSTSGLGSAPVGGHRCPGLALLIHKEGKTGGHFEEIELLHRQRRRDRTPANGVRGWAFRLPARLIPRWQRTHAHHPQIRPDRRDLYFAREALIDALTTGRNQMTLRPAGGTSYGCRSWRGDALRPQHRRPLLAVQIRPQQPGDFAFPLRHEDAKVTISLMGMVERQAAAA